jgi:two-component system response regulator
MIPLSEPCSVKPIDILLVEDNPGDADLTREALVSCKLCNRLHVVRDGEEAMAFLRRQDSYAQAPRPDLMLLDLNLPHKDGCEVLAEVKTDEDFKRIPVVVLTNSQAEEDILRTYNLHANCYVIKPLDLEQFFRVVGSIEDFWLSVAVLPPSEAQR